LSKYFYGLANKYSDYLKVESVSPVDRRNRVRDASIAVPVGRAEGEGQQGEPKAGLPSMESLRDLSFDVTNEGRIRRRKPRIVREVRGREGA
jgi:hypothetical protein